MCSFSLLTLGNCADGANEIQHLIFRTGSTEVLLASLSAPANYEMNA